MSIAMRGQLIVFHAPEPLTANDARRLGYAFESARKSHTPLVLDPGWRIEQIPTRERKRIRLATAERGLYA